MKGKKIANMLFCSILLLMIVQMVSAESRVLVFDDLENKVETQDFIEVEVAVKKSMWGDLSVQNEVLSLLDEDDFVLEHASHTGAGFVGLVSKKGLELLKKNNLVASVYTPRLNYPDLMQSRPIVGANAAWDLGYTGKDQTICVIDSGIDTDNNAFRNGKIVGQQCFCRFGGGCCPNNMTTDTSAEDEDGHGTHVAGIAAGNGFVVKGVAKDADLVAVRACNATGRCSSIDIADAIDWCMVNHKPEVISISLGGDPETNQSICDGSTKGIAINNAYSNGTAVVVSAGNKGNLTAINLNGCAAGSISVGATYDDNVGLKNWTGVPCADMTTAQDQITCFSNRNFQLDLLAPGAMIKSAKLDSFFSLQESAGTSQATPHVAGAIAVLKQADIANTTTNTPEHIRGILKENGFMIHDASGTGLYFPRLDIEKALQTDWPTFHGDNRRTGYNPLQGDLQLGQINDLQLDLIPTGVTVDHYARPSIADLDNDGLKDIVVTTQKTVGVDEGIIFGAEYNPLTGNIEERWRLNIGEAIFGAPSIGNLDSDPELEIVFGTKPGNFYRVDINPSGTSASITWTYSVPAKFSAILAGSYVGELGNSVIADLDRDGTNEIIFTDNGPSVSATDWPGEIYVLNPNGVLLDKIAFETGDGGQFAAPAVADVGDGDNNLEIIAASYRRLEVFDYDSQSLSQKWDRIMSRITGSPMVIDADGDNELEIILSRNTLICPAGFSCNDRVMGMNARTGSVDLTITTPFLSVVTPVAGNLDSDSATEIVVLARDQPGSTVKDGRIVALDTSNPPFMTIDWEFDNSGTLETSFVSPSLVDITGDGNPNILFPANTDNKVYVLDQDGTLNFAFAFSGNVGSALAIGDIDDDEKAEIAVKREGSSILSVLTNQNQKPMFDATISDIVADELDLIDLNASGQVIASDPDADPIQFFFEEPFDANGQWQTDCESQSFFTTQVEVSDGSLRDVQDVQITVNDICSNTTSISAPAVFEAHRNYSESSGAVMLNWSGVSGVEGYKIWFSDNASFIMSLDETTMTPADITLVGDSITTYEDMMAGSVNERYYALAAYQGAALNMSIVRVGKFNISINPDSSIGHTMFSLPLNQTLPISEGLVGAPLFATVIAADDTPGSSDDFVSSFFDGVSWVGTISDLEYGKGYYADGWTNGLTFTNVGQIEKGVAQHFIYDEAMVGHTLIGFESLTPVSLASAAVSPPLFATIITADRSVGSSDDFVFSFFDGVSWVGAISTLEPGIGYYFDGWSTTGNITYVRN